MKSIYKILVSEWKQIMNKEGCGRICSLPEGNYDYLPGGI